MNNKKLNKRCEVCDSFDECDCFVCLLLSYLYKND